MVKSRRRASSSGVPKTLSRRMSRSPLSASEPFSVLFLHLARVRAKGRGLDDLRSEEHVSEAKTAPDDAAVSKEPLDLLRRGAGDDVEVLGLPPQEQVTYAPSNQVGGVIVTPQPLNDLRGVGIDLIRRNLHFAARPITPAQTSKDPQQGSHVEGQRQCPVGIVLLLGRARAAWKRERGSTLPPGAMAGAAPWPPSGRARRGGGGGGGVAARGAGVAAGCGAAVATAAGFFGGGGGGVRSSRTGAAAAATGAGLGAGAVGAAAGAGLGAGAAATGAGLGAGAAAATGAGLGAGAAMGAGLAAAAATGAGRGGAQARAARATASRRSLWPGGGGGGGVVTAMRSGTEDGIVLVGGTSAAPGGGRGDCGAHGGRRGHRRLRFHLDRRAALHRCCRASSPRPPRRPIPPRPRRPRRRGACKAGRADSRARTRR